MPGILEDRQQGHFISSHCQEKKIPKNQKVSVAAVLILQMATLSNNDIVVVWDELVESSEKPSKKIGVQKRDMNGNRLLNKYITSDTSLSSYPVVYGINESTTLVAYTTRKADKNYIYYQVVGME